MTDANGTTTYSYDAVGNQSAVVYPNAFSQRYQYNAVNRLTTLEHVNNGTVTERFSYTLDPTGKRTRLDELNGRSTVWGYDNLNRLTSESISRNNSVEHTESYTLDTVGNRIAVNTNGVTTSYTYNANDRVLTAGNVAYSYDNNGNRLGEVDALTGDFKTYQYNAKNRLVAANTLSDTLGFQYDISGIRTAKTVNGQTTTYLVDSNRDYAQVLIEDTGGATTRYTYGHDLLSQQAANDSRYYLYDGLGSTRALADETGTITDSYEYSAYGTELSQNGATANAYRYTGEQLDEETGLYYLRARYLDPVTGFTQLDSYQGRMQEPVTLHKYLYANGAPSMWTDPSGNEALAQQMEALTVNSAIIGIQSPTPALFVGAAANDALFTTVASASSSAGANNLLRLIVAFALKASSDGRENSTKIPMIVFGQEYPEHATHISESQMGLANSLPTPFSLNYWSGYGRGWLNSQFECDETARAKFPQTMACDEYPFDKAIQGGPLNYSQLGVSLRLVSLDESNRTGGFLSTFYDKAGLIPDGTSSKSKFIVLGIPTSRSFYTDRAGSVHYVSK